MSHTIFLPYPYALDTSYFLHPSVESAFIIGGVTLRKEAGGGNTITWRHGAQGGFPKLFQPRSSTSFGCSRCSFTAGGPACIWKLWAGAEGNRHAKSMGRAHWLAHPPHLPQPQDSPAKGLKPAQASGMWQQPSSLRPERNTVSILFL